MPHSLFLSSVLCTAEFAHTPHLREALNRNLFSSNLYMTPLVFILSQDGITKTLQPWGATKSISEEIPNRILVTCSLYFGQTSEDRYETLQSIISVTSKLPLVSVTIRTLKEARCELQLLPLSPILSLTAGAPKALQYEWKKIKIVKKIPSCNKPRRSSKRERISQTLSRITESSLARRVSEIFAGFKG